MLWFVFALLTAHSFEDISNPRNQSDPCSIRHISKKNEHNNERSHRMPGFQGKRNKRVFAKSNNHDTQRLVYNLILMISG